MTEQKVLYVDEMESPLGILTMVATDAGLCQIQFGSFSSNDTTIKARLKKMGLTGELQHCTENLQQVKRQLHEYFNRKRTAFELPLHLCGTPFQKKVWEALLQIGYGETRSYKQVAQSVGAPKAVRAIGGANNQNPIPVIVPCHRVIGSNGNMVGYGGGLDKKELLLSLEGTIEKIS